MRKIFLSLLATILWLSCVGGGIWLAYQEYLENQEEIKSDIDSIISTEVPFFYFGESGEETTPPEAE